MYDTYVTIVGNVLTAPEWRRTKNTGSLVAHFKVASTARRLDRESGQWVDGNSLRVRVNCWRRLAEGVGNSLITGDPVIVVGRLYTRDWLDENNNRRIGYELEAVAVGHDLSRGQSKFLRNRPAMSTSAVEDERDEQRVGGEQTDPVPADQLPARRDDREFEELMPAMPGPTARVGVGYQAGGALAGDDGDELIGEDDSLGSADDLGGELGGDGPAEDAQFAGGVASVPSSAGPVPGGPGGSGASAGDPMAAPDGLEAGSGAAGGSDLEVEPRGRGRRRARAAVPV